MGWRLAAHCRVSKNPCLSCFGVSMSESAWLSEASLGKGKACVFGTPCRLCMPQYRRSCRLGLGFRMLLGDLEQCRKKEK